MQLQACLASQGPSRPVSYSMQLAAQPSAPTLVQPPQIPPSLGPFLPVPVSIAKLHALAAELSKTALTRIMASLNFI